MVSFCWRWWIIIRFVLLSLQHGMHQVSEKHNTPLTYKACSVKRGLTFLLYCRYKRRSPDCLCWEGIPSAGLLLIQNGDFYTKPRGAAPRPAGQNHCGLKCVDTCCYVCRHQFHTCINCTSAGEGPAVWVDQRQDAGSERSDSRWWGALRHQTGLWIHLRGRSFDCFRSDILLILWSPALFSKYITNKTLCPQWTWTIMNSIKGSRVKTVATCFSVTVVE